MKRIFNLGVLLIVVSLIFSSCKKKNPVEASDINLVAAETNYWGDYYGKNTSVFDLYIFDNKFEASPAQSRTGTIVYFDISGPSGNTYEIQPGTYRATTDRKPFTFQRGERVLNDDKSYSTYGSYFEIWKNGEIVDYWIITSGNLIIEKSGNFTIKGVVTTGDNISYQFIYKGAVDKYDVSPWPETLSKGEVVYEGKVDGENALRNKFTIYLGSENVNLSNLTGDGDILAIELYAPITIGDNIVNGTYKVEFDTKNSMTIMDGFEYLGDDNYYHDGGTWYYTSKKFAIASGDMIVEVTGNNYNLDFQFFTDNGMKIERIINLNMQTFTNAPALKVKPLKRISPDANRNNVRRKLDAPRTRNLSSDRVNNQREILR